MTVLVRYLTHPEVRIDPAVPVPSWGLNDVGRARVFALIEAGWLSGTTEIVSSGERKAVETAQPIADALGVTLDVREGMHENDRSSTGFLEASDFERVADEFFAHPTASVRGWEQAVDAQGRIVREVETILARPSDGDVLLVGHGAVGTLLFCHYSDLSISRVHDQQEGGGCYFSFSKEGRRVLHPWRRMEAPPSE